MATNKYADVSLGTVEAVFNKLGGVDGIKRFLAGNVDVTIREHVIDFEAKPFVPDGWQIESHKKTHPGTVVLSRVGDDLFLPSGRKMELFLSPNQAEGKFVKGDKLRKEIEALRERDMLVLDANVLDYLLKFPELIPESWKVDEKGRTRFIFFWGTIYRYSDGHLYVRYLYWDGGQWGWSDDWLDNKWGVYDPAAVLAS